MYHYQRKLQEEAAKFQPKQARVEEVALKTEKLTETSEDRQVTIDEMLQTLSDKTPQFVIPVSEFFGWFKKSATPSEQVLLTSFSSIVIPRLASKINQHINNPEKVLSILKTECTQKEKDLIAKLASEIIPQFARRYSLSKFEETEWTGSPYYVQKRYQAIKEALINIKAKALEVPDFYKRPPSGWKAITIDDPTGPGIPAISKIIPGIGTILVIYSEGGQVKTEKKPWYYLKLVKKEKLHWAVYGDLSFIPDALCKKAVNPEDPTQVAKAYINLRDWYEIVKAFTQAHNLVMYGRP